MTARTIARWETGVSEPSFRSVWKLAEFFAIEPMDFYASDPDAIAV